MQNLFQDLRFAARMMHRNPGFTALAILALGLGIGANAAVFTVVHGVLLRPLPFPDSERLFLISNAPQGGPFGGGVGLSEDEFLGFSCWRRSVCMAYWRTRSPRARTKSAYGWRWAPSVPT